MRSKNRERKPEKKHDKSAPIEVAQWPLNSEEVIRLRLYNYCGRDVVDLRVWWRARSGQYLPGPRGLTVDVRHLPKLSKGYKKARATAREAGLIDKN
jgi:hypothetical protein